MTVKRGRFVTGSKSGNSLWQTSSKKVGSFDTKTSSGKTFSLSGIPMRVNAQVPLQDDIEDVFDIDRLFQDASAFYSTKAKGKDIHYPRGASLSSKSSIVKDLYTVK